MESIKALLLKHFRAQTTAEEQKVIDAWLAASKANRELFAELNDPDRVARSLEKMDRLHEDQVWERLQAHATGERAETAGERGGATGEWAGIAGEGIGVTGEWVGTGGEGVGVTGKTGVGDTDAEETGVGEKFRPGVARVGKEFQGKEDGTEEDGTGIAGEGIGVTGKTGVGDTDAEETGAGEKFRPEEIRVVHRKQTYLLRRRWWAAAAAIFALLGTGAYWVLHNNAAKKGIALTQQERFRNDVAPGKNAAVLTLAGGQKIVLDSTSVGAISRQGNTTIHNTNGQLVYNELHEKPTELLYNTLTTGRGNQYQLILPDGSKVWLNAASSITYPTTFSGAERKVAITGEAYFEIARDETHPFIVQRKEMSIQVLGTHFNVNAYDDEDALKTTLLKGSVKVTKGSESSILRPGQQAILSRGNAPIKVADHPDIDEVMAWKNGTFRFNDATIESIMREMARWYDVEVIYNTRVSQHFIADVPRDVPVSELLKLLELTDQVHFKIEGKKITVIQ